MLRRTVQQSLREHKGKCVSSEKKNKAGDNFVSFAVKKLRMLDRFFISVFDQCVGEIVSLTVKTV